MGARAAKSARGRAAEISALRKQVPKAERSAKRGAKCRAFKRGNLYASLPNERQSRLGQHLRYCQPLFGAQSFLDPVERGGRDVDG